MERYSVWVVVVQSNGVTTVVDFQWWGKVPLPDYWVFNDGEGIFTGVFGGELDVRQFSPIFILTL